uniref:Uncharacterized protein n=1 Tax=Glossina pallidipes TaxID=7398 RepID=A0A1B0AG82_GLOPL
MVVSPSSSMQTLSQCPSSSWVGVVIRGSTVAFTARLKRLMSNLEFRRTATKPYLLRFSSPAEKFNNSSAVFIRTVPLVSVWIMSKGQENITIFAFSAYVTSPSTNLLKTIP